MMHWYRRYCQNRFRITGALLLVAACVGVLAFASTAGADPARVRDAVYGDVRILLWSEGRWTLNGGNIPGCTTFVGGTSTGPGNIYNADSLVCDPTPTDWHWSVTLPNGSTLQWGVDNMPIDVEVCAQIFYSREHPYLIGKADVDNDMLTVADGMLNDVLYYGPLSTFDAEEEGFIPTQGRRCGIILPLPVGACCFMDGHCEILYRDACEEAGGTYQGDSVACEPNNPCPQPPMACCFQDGHCEFVTAELCERLGGQPQGYGTVCEPNDCPQPPMACCFPDCRCEMLTELDCTENGGVPMGLGVTCDPNPCDCPPPTGACCIGDQGDCLILTEEGCIQQGGRYQGNGSTCEPVNPCPIVPTQNTTWGRIKNAYR